MFSIGCLLWHLFELCLVLELENYCYFSYRNADVSSTFNNFIHILPICWPGGREYGRRILFKLFASLLICTVYFQGVCSLRTQDYCTQQEGQGEERGRG